MRDEGAAECTPLPQLHPFIRMGCSSSVAAAPAPAAGGSDNAPVARDEIARNNIVSGGPDAANEPRHAPRQNSQQHGASMPDATSARVAWDVESWPFAAAQDSLRCVHCHAAEREHALFVSVDLFTHTMQWASPAMAAFMQNESVLMSAFSGPVSALNALTVPSQRAAIAALARARTRYERVLQGGAQGAVSSDNPTAEVRADAKLREKLTRDRVCEVEYVSAGASQPLSAGVAPILAAEALAASAVPAEVPPDARLLRVRWRMCTAADGSLLPRICCDIEDLQRTQALLQARARVEALETKLRNTSMFTRTVLHEVRVPFTSISSGIAELDEIIGPLVSSSDSDSLLIPRSTLMQALEVLDLMASGSSMLRRLLEQGLLIQRSGDNRIRMRREPCQLLPSIQMCVQVQAVDSYRKNIRLLFQWYAAASLRPPNLATTSTSGSATTRRSPVRSMSAAAEIALPNDSARGNSSGVHATPFVVADDSMLERSVSNYISNAIKFSKRDSTVTVTAMLLPLARLREMMETDVTSGSPVALPSSHAAISAVHVDSEQPDSSADEPSLFFVDKSRATPAPSARAPTAPPIPAASADTPYSTVSGDASAGGHTSSFFGTPQEAPAPAPQRDVTVASPGVVASAAGFSTESTLSGAVSARASPAAGDPLLLRAVTNVAAATSVASPVASFAPPTPAVQPTVALALQQAQVELEAARADALLQETVRHVNVPALLRHAVTAVKADGSIAAATARAASAMHLGAAHRDATMGVVDEGGSVRPSSASGSAGGRTHASTPMSPIERKADDESPVLMEAGDGLARWAVACILVTDTGPGIAAADQHKLFQPYSQIQPMKLQGGGGTGLGLSIVQESVRMHGGQTGVISSAGAGATFFMVIPLQLAAPAASLRSTSQPHLPAEAKGVAAPVTTPSRWAASTTAQLHDIHVASSTGLHLPGAAVDDESDDVAPPSVALRSAASSTGMLTATTPLAATPAAPSASERVDKLLQADEEEETILVSGSSHSPSPPRHPTSSRGRPPPHSSKYDVSMHTLSMAPPSSATLTSNSALVTQTLTAASEVSARDPMLIITERTPTLSVRAMPRGLGAAAPPITVAASTSPIATASRHMLVIDDDAIIQRVCQELLTRHSKRVGRPCTVHCESRGMDGIAYILQLAGRPPVEVTAATLASIPALTADENTTVGTQLALICVDYSMPGTTGPDIVRTLRYQLGLQSVKIIGLTGHADAHTHGQFVLAGAASVLVKPFEAAGLMAQLPV